MYAKRLFLFIAVVAGGCGNNSVADKGEVSKSGIDALEAAAPPAPAALGMEIVAGPASMLIIYPASDAGKGSPTALVHADTEPLARRFGADAAATLLAARGRAKLSAAISTEPKPLLIFAPGAGMPGVAYRVLAENLAARGMIVAILDPQRSMPASEESIRALESEFARAWGALRRRGDLPIDWTRVFLAGHSLGGAAAVDMLHRLPAHGAVNLDGDYLFDTRRPSPDRPILYITGEDTRGGKSTADRRAADWAVVSGGRPDALRLHFSRARHHDFSDVSVMPRTLISGPGREQLGPSAPGAIEGKAADAIAAFVTVS